MLHETLLPLSSLILDGVPQPVWVVDDEGNIVFANRAAVDALGYNDRTELEGKPSHSTVHHSHGDGSPFPDAECRMLLPARSQTHEHGDDYWFARRDGSLFPISWWAAPIDLPTSPGVVVAFTDITERLELERLTRERDAAQVRAEASRAAQRRVVEATAEIRRRTARDLHDGAQQRLVSLAILLQLAAEQMSGNPAAAALLDRAAAEAKAAIDDLRELASGVYPASLSTGGLQAAVDSLAARSPYPVRARIDLPGRLDPSVEAHAYFLIAEALTNAVKHANPTVIEIDAHLTSSLNITVRDDGVGGVIDTRAGSGLTGMRDRVEALGGSLTISSPGNRGTAVTIRVPAELVDAA